MRPIACRDSFFSLSIHSQLLSRDVFLNEAAPAFMPSQYGVVYQFEIGLSPSSLRRSWPG